MVHEAYNKYKDVDGDSSVIYWADNFGYGIFVVFYGDLETAYYWGINDMSGGAGYEWQEGMAGIGLSAYNEMINKAKNGDGLNKYINDNFYEKWHFKEFSKFYPIY